MSDKERDQFIQHKTEPPHPTFDDVLEKLGNPGRFQLTQIAMAFHSQLFMAFMTFAFVFYGYEPAHVCNSVNETSFLAQHGLLNDSTATVSYGSCDLVVSSNQTGQERHVLTTSCPEGRNFSDRKDTTWLSYWDLVCESQGPAELSFSAYNAGWIVGGLIALNLADRFGRRIVFLTGLFLCFLWEGLVLVAPNMYYIMALRVLVGFFRPWLSGTYFVFALELIVPRHREYCGVVLCIMWTLQTLLVAAVAFIFQDYNWRYVHGAGLIFAVTCFAYPFFLSESPRWLTAKKRYKEALAVLEKACKQSGKNFEEVKALYLLAVADKAEREDMPEKVEIISKDPSVQDVPLEVETVVTNPSIITLLRHWDTLVLTLSVIFVWLTHNMTYYGLYMTSSSIAGNRFVNFCLMCLVEIPSNLIILFMMKRMTRLFVLRLFLSLAGLALLASTIVVTFGNSWSWSDTLMTILFIFGSLTITASYNVVFIMTPEIFPTNLRATGFAACSSVSHSGSMISPFFRPLMATVQWGPGAIFTGMILISLALTKILPDTKDKQLDDTVEDFRKSIKEKKREIANGK